MRHLVLLAALTTLTCCDGASETSKQNSTTAPTSVPSAPGETDSIISSDVSYTVIGSHTVPGIKRSLNVRLNKKVNAETLRAIALKLKAEDFHTYERTFIVYYLPDMTLGAGAWASTHFDPSLEVRILGLTIEDEKKLAAQTPPPNRQIIGSWLDESPGVSSHITIFNESGKLYMEHKFKDGSALKKELIEKRTSVGRRFDKAEGSRAGDHWVIEPSGNLQSRNNDGLIATAKKTGK